MAAVLNAASPDVAYFYTVFQIVDLVTAALASGDAAATTLAGELDALNNGPGGCPLN